MLNQPIADARERVLLAAERLFAERGYSAVTLRDIGHELGMRHTSLYYHFPSGKEEMYVEVTARRMQRYRAGLEQALSTASPDLLGQLRATANWMLAQEHMHLGRMLQSEMPVISEAASEKLRLIVFESLLKPLENIFSHALADNPTQRGRSAILAGMFLSLIEGIDNLPSSYLHGPKQDLVDVVLDVLMNGLK